MVSGQFSVLYSVLSVGLLIPGILSAFSVTPFDSQTGDYHQLKAVRRSSDLLKRDPVIHLTHSTELNYANAENHEIQSSIFVSTVKVVSQTPFLVLEEIEHHIVDVTCGASDIQLSFTDKGSFDMAVEVCSHLVGSYVITSHAGCNDDGARVPFLVHSILFTDDLTIALSTTESSWRNAFQTVKIDFGHSTESHQIRDFGPQKRTTPTDPLIATSVIPTTDPTATFANLDLSSKNIDTTFDLGPKAANINAGCKDCTTTGQLKLTQGSFDLIDANDIDIFGDDSTRLDDIITDGFVQLDMTFSAHIELKIAPTLEGNFEHTLFSVPILGFAIPEFGKAGIFFNSAINFNWALQAGVEMSYGFELKIPDDSQIHINLANMTESTVRGFDKTSVTPVPFQANISDISLTMELALRPRIAVEFGFLENKVVAQAGVYIDLPNINTTIAQLPTTGFNEKCEPRASTPTQDEEFNKVYSNYTHISRNIGLAVGLDMLLNVDVPGPNLEKNWNTPLASTTTSLPASCLVFNKNKAPGQRFAVAETVRANDFKDNGKKSGAGRVASPLGLEIVLFGSLWSVIIVAIATFFMML